MNKQKILIPVIMLILLLGGCDVTTLSSSLSMQMSQSSLPSSSVVSSSSNVVSSSSQSQTSASTSQESVEEKEHTIVSADIPTTEQSKYLSEQEITIRNAIYWIDQIQQGTGSYANHIQMAKSASLICNLTPMKGTLTITVLDKTDQWNTVKPTITVYSSTEAKTKTNELTPEKTSMNDGTFNYDVYTYTLSESFFSIGETGGERVAYVKEIKIAL